MNPDLEALREVLDLCRSHQSMKEALDKIEKVAAYRVVGRGKAAWREPFRCGCVRFTDWERCDKHDDLQHHEEP